MQPPASYHIQYWNGGSWVDITNPTKTPATPAASLNTVDFDTVTSPKLQVVFINNGGSYSGLVELEVFLHTPAADETATSAVMTAIEQLPLQAAVTLSEKSAIAAARTAYDHLSVSQKSLVTNLSKLTDAEAAIAALEAAQIPKMKDVAVLSAFSNADGDTITIKLSSNLDDTYGMQAAKFQIIANTVSVSVASADYDSADSSHTTIKLTLSTPALLNATMATLSLQSGALKTNNNELNNAINSIAVITFKKLNLSHDNRIGVDDVVLMMVNPSSQIDVNQDGIFNRDDISIILGQISMYLR